MLKKYAAIGLIVLAGCATPEQQVLNLQSKTKDLQGQVEQRDQQIKQLNEQVQTLQQDKNYYSTRSTVLEKEKTARVQEAESMRKGVREFTDQVITSLNTYFQRAEIVDYTGGEIVSRRNLSDEKNVLLIDMAHPITLSGTIIGGRAFVTTPARIQFCLIRFSAGGKGEVVGLSREIVADKAGAQSWTFDVPMAAKQGDLIGLSMDTCNVPYDDVDTGDVRALRGPVRLNSPVSVASAKDKNKRAYSFGVIGYFDQKK